MANLSFLRPLLWIAIASACSQPPRKPAEPAALADGECTGDTCDPESPPPEVAAAQAAEAAAPVDRATAMAAYDAKDYRRCARMFTTLAERSTGRAQADGLYSAACCHALGGDAGAAFALLDRAFAAGFRDQATLEQDSDLASLRGDRRWPGAVEAIRARIAAWERSLGAPELRKELLALAAEDQAALKAWIARRDDATLKARVDAVNASTLRRLKQVVDQHGWPGNRLVGEDGASAAWLLVQHADKDPAFQRRCLALMEPMIATGEVSAIDYAYLYDRVAVADKRPQRYGTQFDDNRQPRPIEDEANVDARRKAIGLKPMAEYRKDMAKMYGWDK